MKWLALDLGQWCGSPGKIHWGIMEVPCFKSDWKMVHCSASFWRLLYIYTQIYIYIYTYIYIWLLMYVIYIYMCVCMQGWIIETSRHHVTTEWRDFFWNNYPQMAELFRLVNHHDWLIQIWCGRWLGIENLRSVEFALVPNIICINIHVSIWICISMDIVLLNLSISNEYIQVTVWKWIDGCMNGFYPSTPNI